MANKKKSKKVWCSHYWREDKHMTDFVSPDGSKKEWWCTPLY